MRPILDIDPIVGDLGPRILEVRPDLEAVVHPFLERSAAAQRQKGKQPAAPP